MPQAKTNDLAARQCQPCRGGVPPLTRAQIDALIQSLEGWQEQNNEISKTYSFQNYYQTMAFVNAVAWISHRQDHHPDLDVGYNRCRVRYSTHAIGGLSDNDFICAAKIETLLRL